MDLDGDSNHEMIRHQGGRVTNEGQDQEQGEVQGGSGNSRVGSKIADLALALCRELQGDHNNNNNNTAAASNSDETSKVASTPTAIITIEEQHGSYTITHLLTLLPNPTHSHYHPTPPSPPHLFS